LKGKSEEFLKEKRVELRGEEKGRQHRRIKSMVEKRALIRKVNKITL
jgi:hypothetical protein